MYLDISCREVTPHPCEDQFLNTVKRLEWALHSQHFFHRRIGMAEKRLRDLENSRICRNYTSNTYSLWGLGPYNQGYLRIINYHPNFCRIINDILSYYPKKSSLLNSCVVNTNVCRMWVCLVINPYPILATYWLGALYEVCCINTYNATGQIPEIQAICNRVRV